VEDLHRHDTQLVMTRLAMGARAGIVVDVIKMAYQ
jgi:hypothetical protein